MSLKEFVSNIRHRSDQKVKKYEKKKTKKVSASVETVTSNINKRRITSKFPVKSTEVSVYGTKKSKRNKLNL